MARLVIHNSTILTLDENDSFYYLSTVEIVGDCIAKVYSGYPEGAVLNDLLIIGIDGKDKLVMLGFVDLHSNMSFVKGFGDKLPLKEYLDKVWDPSVRALTKEQAYTAALYSYCTAMKSGITAVNDMYRFVGSLADAASRTGMRARLSNEVALAEHKMGGIYIFIYIERDVRDLPSM